MSDHDAFRHDLGVYVLGALRPAERDRVEEHLADCAECRDEVASLAVLPGLLRRVADEDSAAAQPPAVGAVIARLADHRRRSRRRERLLAVVAAFGVAVAVAAVALAPLRQAGEGGERFAADAGAVAATVEHRAWGMAVTIEADSLPQRPGYVAVAVSKDGHRAQVASWSDTGRPVTVDGACYLEPDEVARMEILAAPEEEVLAVLRPGD